MQLRYSAEATPLPPLEYRLLIEQARAGWSSYPVDQRRIACLTAMFDGPAACLQPYARSRCRIWVKRCGVPPLQPQLLAGMISA